MLPIIVYEKSALLLLLLTASSAAFSSHPFRPNDGKRNLSLHSDQTTLKTNDARSAGYQVLSDFESWFDSQTNAKRHPAIQHIFFGNLRGLRWKSKDNKIPSRPVVKVPISIVLQSDMQLQPSDTSDAWDAQLASQLWSEFCLGDKSKIVGYCEFLTGGVRYSDIADGAAPPNTAPNALRHWKHDTPEALSILAETAAGKKLIDMEQDQQTSWKKKYGHLISTTGVQNITWEQFRWAMEVVHSRAFRGNFGCSDAAEANLLSTLAINAAPTVGAALAGWVYIQNNLYPDPVIIGALAIAAVIPVGMNVLSSSSTPPSAVLLPLVDSANHDENADSSIKYDPASKCFQLTVGPKCLAKSPVVIASSKDDIQLSISYGKRKDSELLLNYGFLPSIPCADDSSVAVQRTALAEEFNRKNR